MEEAEIQQEARASCGRVARSLTRRPARPQALEQLEEKVIEVAAAEESEAEHAAAAEAAAERGDMTEAEDQAEMAEEAAEEAEMAEEDLADAVAAEKELASMSLAERFSPITLANAVSAYTPQVYEGATAAVENARSTIRTGLDRVLGDYPLLATFLEWLSLVLPVAILTGGFALLRRDSAGEFSLRSEVLLFGHMCVKLSRALSVSRSGTPSLSPHAHPPPQVLGRLLRPAGCGHGADAVGAAAHRVCARPAGAVRRVPGPPPAPLHGAAFASSQPHARR